MAGTETPADQPAGQLTADQFKTEMRQTLPHLRAFARNLVRDAERGDDIVQEAMLKAWAARDRFTPGTSFKAWLFVIARNIFLSEMRRAKFHGEYDPDAAERILVTPASQSDTIALGDLQRALYQLPLQQREALLLVGAGELAYEEAALICDCAVGTIKSRVSRARAALEVILESGQLDVSRANAPGASLAFDSILASVPTASSAK